MLPFYWMVNAIFLTVKYYSWIFCHKQEILNCMVKFAIFSISAIIINLCPIWPLRVGIKARTRWRYDMMFCSMSERAFRERNKKIGGKNIRTTLGSKKENQQAKQRTVKFHTSKSKCSGRAHYLKNVVWGNDSKYGTYRLK